MQRNTWGLPFLSIWSCVSRQRETTSTLTLLFFYRPVKSLLVGTKRVFKNQNLQMFYFKLNKEWVIFTHSK